MKLVFSRINVFIHFGPYLLHIRLVVPEKQSFVKVSGIMLASRLAGWIKSWPPKLSPVSLSHSFRVIHFQAGRQADRQALTPFHLSLIADR